MAVPITLRNALTARLSDAELAGDRDEEGLEPDELNACNDGQDCREAVSGGGW